MASLNLGVVMCIACSAAHRALGSHVSQVLTKHTLEKRFYWTLK